MAEAIDLGDEMTIHIIVMMIMLSFGIFCCVLAFFVMNRLFSMDKEMRAIEYEAFKKLLK